MDIINFFLEPYQTYSITQIILEAIAAILGILSVWYARKQNILVYPTGIISTGLYAYLLFGWQLYGDMVINVYYFIMSIVGWYIWTRKVDATHLTPITQMTKKDIIYSIFIFLTSFIGILIIYKYKPYINSGFRQDAFNNIYNYIATDYVDAFTTGTAFIAMWLMAKKKLQHWHFWIVTNIIAIPLYFWFKKHGITGIQYIVFLTFAILGLKEWKKSLDKPAEQTL
jgi:nicotinamide mononucleotide transporter